jgi:16S rRNA (guanine(966)-N(2))-methyltransferase RsmD
MRITGGVHRSRALRAPAGESTRPTSDRVREALFGILAARRTLERIRVLDLYAGTGALALEALSRGAAWATLVERSRPALAAIEENVAALRMEAQVRVVAGVVERSMSSIAKDAPFDLVFADPPYALVTRGEAVRTLVPLVDGGVMASDALLVLEHAKDDASPAIRGLSLADSRRYGDTVIAFYAGAPG